MLAIIGHPDSVCHQWSMVEWEYVRYTISGSGHNVLRLKIVFKELSHIVL
jgi:hypothetical protein